MEETRRLRELQGERPSTLSANFTFGSRKLSVPAARSRTAWPTGVYVQGRKSIRDLERRCEQPLITETAFIGYRAWRCTHRREQREREGEREGVRQRGREEGGVNRGGREKEGNDVEKNRGSRGEIGGGQGEDKKEAERERKPSSTAVAGQEVWLYGGSGMRSSSWASGSFVIRNTSRYCARGREKSLRSRSYACEMERAKKERKMRKRRNRWRRWKTRDFIESLHATWIISIFCDRVY